MDQKIQSLNQELISGLSDIKDLAESREILSSGLTPEQFIEACEEGAKKILNGCKKFREQGEVN